MRRKYTNRNELVNPYIASNYVKPLHTYYEQVEARTKNKTAKEPNHAKNPAHPDPDQLSPVLGTPR